MEKLKTIRRNLMIHLNKHCEKAKVINDFFDMLKKTDEETQLKYLMKIDTFIKKYKIFFKSFSNEQKLALFNAFLKDKKNIEFIVGKYPLYLSDRKTKFNTMWENIWKLYLKLEKKKLKEE